MSKRGQITMFLVIGIVLVVIFGLFYYMRTSFVKEETTTSVKKIVKTAFETIHIEKYVENCLKEVSEDGLWRIGRYGGYIDLDGVSKKTIYQEKEVPYYLIGTDSSIPKLEDIELELLSYIDIEFEKCLDLSIFEGFNITKPDSDSVSIEAKINIDTVTVQLKYPLTIIKQDAETKLEDFRVHLPIRLGRLYNISVDMSSLPDLVDDIKGVWSSDGTYNIGNFDCDAYDPLNQMNIFAKNNDDADSHTRIIQLVDYNSFYYDYVKSYVFQFAIKKTYAPEDPVPFIGERCSEAIVLT